MGLIARIALWFATSRTGQLLALVGGGLLAIGIALLKAFNAGKQGERQRIENQAHRELEGALKEQKGLADESRTMRDADLDRDNSKWLRP